MKNPFASIALPQDRFNAWSLVVSFLALLVAIAAVFANGVPNWMKSQKVSVYPDKGFVLQQNLGAFSTILTTTVVNSGGSDVGLKEMNVDLAFENGNKLRLVGDSWYKHDNASYNFGAVTSYQVGEYRLSDVVVRPGQTWTGIVRLTEKAVSEHSEAREDFNTAMYKEQRKRVLSHEEALRNSYKGFMAAITSGKDKRTEPSVDWSLLSNSLPQQCAPPTPTLVDRGRDLTVPALQRIGKGKHSAKLNLVADGQAIFDSSYDFVLFERELRAFQDAESLVPSICLGTTNGISAYTNSPFSSIRIALTPRDGK